MFKLVMYLANELSFIVLDRILEFEGNLYLSCYVTIVMLLLCAKIIIIIK